MSAFHTISRFREETTGMGEREVSLRKKDEFAQRRNEKGEKEEGEQRENAFLEEEEGGRRSKKGGWRGTCSSSRLGPVDCRGGEH